MWSNVQLCRLHMAKQVITVIFAMTCTIVGSELSCYSCDYDNIKEECLNSQEACQWGQICFNTVYRHPFLGMVYTKGCKDQTHCQSAEALNDWRYCDSTPSSCVYCCDTDLCNSATRRVVVSMQALTLWISCAIIAFSVQ